MISINLVHSLILKSVNEKYPAMPQKDRARLAQCLARDLHPVMVEQIQREIDAAAEVADPIGRGQPVGGDHG